MNQTNDDRTVVSRRRLPALGALLLGAGVSLVSVAASAVGAGVQDVDSVRATQEQWVQVRRSISEERKQWKLGKQLMTDRIEVVQHEIEKYRALLDEAKANIADADKKRTELFEELDKLKEASAAFPGAIANFEGRTKELLARSPEPIVELVKPFTQRFPDDAGETEQTLSQRFPNVVATLNAINKFNREITINNEVRTLGDGSTAEVMTLYAGLGQAFYVNSDATAAGIGTSSDEGWIWTAANEAAADVAAAVAIMKGQPASFVRLPVRID